MPAAMLTTARGNRRRNKIAGGQSIPQRGCRDLPSHRVGRIERVGFEEIARYRLNLIRNLFTDNQMTRRVPFAQVRAVGLPKLASPQAVAGALTKFPGRPRTSRLIWAKRAQGYLAKINTGNPDALAPVVRDLQLAGDGSVSRFSQRNLFELAFDRLAGEVAAVNRTR